MPETARAVDSTHPADAGHTTTEWSITKVATAIGALLEVSVVPGLIALKDAFPQFVWVPVVLGLAGVVLQIAVALGYQKSRATVKVALADILSAQAGAGANEDLERPAMPATGTGRP